jgi:uncharacterized protein YcaQ
VPESLSAASARRIALAAWQGLRDVTVSDRGDLARELAAALGMHALS